jgi:hypothetical protein
MNANARRGHRRALTLAAVTFAASAAAAGAADNAAAVIADWPPTPKEVAQTTIAKYGQPDGVTSEKLIWMDEGPWKAIVVNRREIPHSFPKAHTDLLEGVIDYRVPPDKFDELAAYDGSVIAERTKGTLAARCDKEEMNFLALNLANDIVTGKKTVAAARKEYADTAMAFMKGEKRPYTQGLQFDVKKGGTGDPDQPAPMK